MVAGIPYWNWSIPVSCPTTHPLLRSIFWGYVLTISLIILIGHKKFIVFLLHTIIQHTYTYTQIRRLFFLHETQIIHVFNLALFVFSMSFLWHLSIAFLKSNAGSAKNRWANHEHRTRNQLIHLDFVYIFLYISKAHKVSSG